MQNRGWQLVSIVLILLSGYFIRVHHLTQQDPYVDEALHIKRAAVVWDFEQNPARFAHGKMLLYFWLGLFETEPSTALFSGRYGMVLFSLLTMAVLYQLGRQMSGHGVGWLAMLLYAVMPYAFFYERMAMADPFAAGLAGLVAWRSLIFARRPARREGIIIGILLGLTSLAKLTMGLLPLLPLLAALIYFNWHSLADFRRWLWCYIPPLMLAAVMVLLIWSPFVIPAYLARHTDQPFILVNDLNLNDPDQPEIGNPLAYFEELLPLLPDFTSSLFLYLAGAGALIGFLLAFLKREALRPIIFLWGWFLLLILLTALTANLETTRYFVPALLPTLLLIAYVIMALWHSGYVYRLMATGLVVGLMVWMISFALPFARILHHDYRDIHLTREKDVHTSWTEYQSGYFLGDLALRQAAADVNALESEDGDVIATWAVCSLLYFYLDADAQCLGWQPTYRQMRDYLNHALVDGDSAYLIFSGVPHFFENIDGLGYEQIARYDRPNIRNPFWDVWVFRVWWE